MVKFIIYVRARILWRAPLRSKMNRFKNLLCLLLRFLFLKDSVVWQCK